MNLISRLINKSGLRISHSKVFSSGFIGGYPIFQSGKDGFIGGYPIFQSGKPGFIGGYPIFQKHKTLKGYLFPENKVTE